MSNKHELKKKRKTICLETKIQILDRLAKGERSSHVGRIFGLHEATIRTIKKNEVAIRRSIICGTIPSTKASSYSRDLNLENTEKALVLWIKGNTQKRISLDGNTIRQKALHIYHQVKEIQPSSSSGSRKYDFSASKGWLSRFLQRHALNNIKMKELPDEKAAEEFSKKLHDIIDSGGYNPDQVFNADESDLFWKKMPIQTYAPKSQKQATNFKTTKDRVTVLFCSNASGDRILKPLLVNQSLRPHTMKNVDLSTLPVHWMANKKGWITVATFTEWFQKCFLPEVKTYLESKGLEYKVLLILDHTASYPHLENPNVEILFLPPNTTSLIQPLQQGIIATLKSYYVKQTFQYILNELNKDKTLTLTDVWKKFSIMDCVKCIDLAMSKLKSSTLNACWKAVWPECVKNNGVPSCKMEYSNNHLINDFDRKGFEDLALDDIKELITDTVPENKELIKAALDASDRVEINNSKEETSFSASIIEEGLKLADKLEHHFLVNDTDIERATRFQRDLRNCMTCYKELFKSKLKQVSSQLIQNYKVEDMSSGGSDFILKEREQMRCTTTESDNE